MQRKVVLGVFALVGLVLVLAFDQPWLRVVVALAVSYLLLRVGVVVIGSFARPVPPAPPPGELRIAAGYTRPNAYRSGQALPER